MVNSLVMLEIYCAFTIGLRLERQREIRCERAAFLSWGYYHFEIIIFKIIFILNDIPDANSNFNMILVLTASYKSKFIDIYLFNTSNCQRGISFNLELFLLFISLLFQAIFLYVSCLI